MPASEIGADALTEAFEYLDNLRSSGLVNMWASHAFLARDLAWPDAEARAATGYWRDTFSKELPVNERVEKALAETE